MPVLRRPLKAASVALLLALAAHAPAHAAIVNQTDGNLVIQTDQEQPAAGASVSIVSTDGTFKADGYTDARGNICVLGVEGAPATRTANQCIELPDGNYRLFVNADPSVRFTVENGVIDIPPPPRKASTGLLIGAGVVGVAALGGGGGGGGGSDVPDEPVEPVESVGLSVSPQMLEGEFEFGASPCPTTVGTVTVTNTGDLEARIAANPVEGVSVTGTGQLLAPGDSGTVTVLFNCLVVSAIAGSIEILLTTNGQSASANVEVVVDFL